MNTLFTETKQRLYEQYRPKSWDEVIGQDKIVKRIQVMKQRNSLAGRAYWISGKSGQGKTTIAYLLAKEIADDFCIQEIDATELTPAYLKQLEQEQQMYGWNSSGRAYIVNEAHGLRRDTVRQLLVMLERLPSHVLWIFTTTVEGQTLFEGAEDSHPLLSRCIEFSLAQRGLAELWRRRQKKSLTAKAWTVSR